MKKLIISVLSLLTVFTLAACTNNEEKKEEENVDNNEQIANPWSEYVGLEEAIKDSGIDISVPTSNIEGVTYIKDEIIEVDYKDGTSIRKGTVENISGDYNTYSETKEVIIGNYTVTLSLNDSKVYLATFSYNGYNYSVSCEGLSVEEVTAIINDVK